MKLDIKLHNDDLPANLDLGDNIAVDCEFMGLNVERDKLCLVQISTGKNDAHIIKLNRQTYNAPNLKKVLTNKKIKKIFHYARADTLFIKKYLKIDVENIECTKLMSKIARSYSDKHGLKDLIKEFTGVEISKGLQSSDFGGELSEKQLQYCAKDVIYLHSIFASLEKILLRENRHYLYIETVKFLRTRVLLDLASFSEDVWSH
tara:strand:+ start:43 stop:654 length:612 start_codon:yes stop_codon:yes gene_type:complete